MEGVVESALGSWAKLSVDTRSRCISTWHKRLKHRCSEYTHIVLLDGLCTTSSASLYRDGDRAVIHPRLRAQTRRETESPNRTMF